MNDEYEYRTTIDGLMVGVDKNGGGTVGRSYSGENWTVTVMNGPVYVFDRDILRIPMAATHAEAARLAAEWASEYIDAEA